MELNFLFSAYLVDEGGVVTMALPSVVCDFSDVFPKNLMELSLHWEIKFSIDLYQAPRSIVLIELQELNVQIQDLLDKGFIQPSASS